MHRPSSSTHPLLRHIPTVSTVMSLLRRLEVKRAPNKEKIFILKYNLIEENALFPFNIFCTYVMELLCSNC